MAVFGYLLLSATLLGVCYCYVRPAFAFVLVMCLYPAKQLMQSYLGFFGANSSVYNYLIFLGVLMGVFGNIVRKRGVAGYGNRVFWLLLATYFYAIFTILWTPSKDSALEVVFEGAPYWLMQIILLPLCVASLDDFRAILPHTVIAGALVAVLFFINPQTSFYAGRLTLVINLDADLRGNPLATAQMGCFTAIAAVLMLPRQGGPLMALVRLGGMFLGLGLAVASGSRGQLIFGVACAFFFYPMARQVRDMRQFVGTVAGLGVLGFVGFLAISYFLGQNAEQSTRWNISNWGDTLTTRSNDALGLLGEWLATPTAWPFGLGSNAFAAASDDKNAYAHNLPIEMLAERGILGLILLCMLFYWCFRIGQWLWRSGTASDPHIRAAAAVLLSMTAYLTLLSFKQGTFLSIPEPWYMLILVAKLGTQEQQLWAGDATTLAEPDYRAQYADLAAEYSETTGP